MISVVLVCVQTLEEVSVLTSLINLRFKTLRLGRPRLSVFACLPQAWRLTNAGFPACGRQVHLEWCWCVCSYSIWCVIRGITIRFKIPGKALVAYWVCLCARLPMEGSLERFHWWASLHHSSIPSLSYSSMWIREFVRRVISSVWKVDSFFSTQKWFQFVPEHSNFNTF